MSAKLFEVIGNIFENPELMVLSRNHLGPYIPYSSGNGDEQVGTVFNVRCINMSRIFFRLTVDNRRVTAKARTIA
jgi:hypothetical protein